MSIYVALVIAVSGPARHPDPDWPVLIHYTLAVLPALPIIAVFIAFGRYLQGETDEYVRYRAVLMALGATLVTLSVTTVWGFLEIYGVARHLPAFYVAIVWFVGLGISTTAERITRLLRRP
jgi:hypothetical protein